MTDDIDTGRLEAALEAALARWGKNLPPELRLAGRAQALGRVYAREVLRVYTSMIDAGAQLGMRDDTGADKEQTPEGFVVHLLLEEIAHVRREQTRREGH